MSCKRIVGSRQTRNDGNLAPLEMWVIVILEHFEEVVPTSLGEETNPTGPLLPILQCTS